MNKTIKERLTEVLEDYIGESIADYNDSLTVSHGLTELDEVEITIAIEEEFNIDMPDTFHETPNEILQEIENQLKD